MIVYVQLFPFQWHSWVNQRAGQREGMTVDRRELAQLGKPESRPERGRGSGQKKLGWPVKSVACRPEKTAIQIQILHTASSRTNTRFFEKN